jgi:hypothetical protein
MGKGISFHKGIDNNKVYKVIAILENNGQSAYVFAKGKNGTKAVIAHKILSIDRTIEATESGRCNNGIITV